MNVLFLSLADMTSIDGSDLYSDLLKMFVANHHHVDIISPIQKRSNTSDNDIEREGYSIYKPHVGNISNTGFVEKGISILTYRKQIIDCIKEKIGYVTR